MADWRQHAGKDWRAMAGGGAEGGPPGDEPINADAKIAVAPTPAPPKTPAELAREADEAEYAKQVQANSLTRGQWLHDLGKHDPEAAKKFLRRRDTGAAAELLSLARGATGPIGSHLDEITGALQSGHISGPEYEQKRDLARQTLDAATNHAPLGPVIGAMMLPQPSGAMGRIGLNTLTGASEGIGDTKTLDGAPSEAIKKAAVAAVLSILSEGAAKGARGTQGAMERGAENQALKGAGLHGGIGSQQAKMGMDDVEAQALGRRMLDEGLIPFGGTKADVKARAQALQGQAGMSIGAQLAHGDTLGALDYDELGNAALKPYNDADAVMRSTGGKSLDLVDQFGEQGRMTPGSFVGANRAKSSAWASANFKDDAPNAAKLYRRTTGAAAGNIEDQLSRLDPQAADALRSANERYGVAADTLGLATDAARREQANNTLGLTELLTGVGGATLGSASGHPVSGALTGIGTAALANLARKRGNSAAAVMLDKLSAPVGGSLDVLGQGIQAAEPAMSQEANRPTGLLAPYLEFLHDKDNEQ